MIEIRQLRYFVVVAEELHFGRAAERLHMSQSPLSHQIRLLESALGVQLIDRAHHVTGLTAAGLSYRDAARAILAQVDEAAERAKNAASGVSGVLKLGIVGDLGSAQWPKTVGAFAAHFPEVELHLRDAGPGESDEALRHGVIDLLATAARPVSDDICFDHVIDEALMVAAPAGRFATATTISLDELECERFVVLSYRTTSGSRTHLETVRALCRYAPRVGGQASSLMGLLMMVASGMGIALVPSGVSRSSACPGVDFLDLLPTVTVQSGVAWKRGSTSPMVANFLEFAAHEVDPRIDER